MERPIFKANFPTEELIKQLKHNSRYMDQRCLLQHAFCQRDKALPLVCFKNVLKKNTCL